MEPIGLGLERPIKMGSRAMRGWVAGRAHLTTRASKMEDEPILVNFVFATPTKIYFEIERH